MEDRSKVLARAAQAQQLLDSGLLDAMEADYTKRWRDTKSDQTGEREMLWLSLRVIEDMKDKLRGQVGSGKIVKTEIARENAQDQEAQ